MAQTREGQMDQVTGECLFGKVRIVADGRPQRGPC